MVLMTWLRNRAEVGWKSAVCASSSATRAASRGIAASVMPTSHAALLCLRRGAEWRKEAGRNRNGGGVVSQTARDLRHPGGRICRTVEGGCEPTHTRNALREAARRRRLVPVMKAAD